ncbi:MAG: M48 family metallopeptidase [Actinomycetota bacterium]
MMSSRYPVEVIRSERRVKTVSARIVDGVIRVRIPSWMSAADEARFVDDVVTKIEQERRSHAVDLEARAARLADEYDLPRPESIRWSKTQSQRWGSCSVHSGDVRISNRLVDVPPWVLDYVIIHELAHLVEANHSPAFHAIVDRYHLAERATGYLMAVSDRLDRAEPDAPAAVDASHRDSFDEAG